MSLVEHYMAKARKAHAEFLDKLVLGEYPNFPLGIYISPFQLESYYVRNHASRRLPPVGWVIQDRDRNGTISI